MKKRGMFRGSETRRIEIRRAGRAGEGGVHGYLVGVGDEAVALHVGGEDDGEHAEHGVAAVPALSVGGDAEAAGGELGVALGVLLDGVGHGVGGLHGDAVCSGQKWW